MRRYEIVVIRRNDVVVREWTSPEYFDRGDELSLDGGVVLVYRVERLPNGVERLICFPAPGDDPRAHAAA